VLKRLIREHERILEAIVGGDAENARRLSGEHVLRYYRGTMR
jgi:DNA-binding GntR family transcriptional regulator